MPEKRGGNWVSMQDLRLPESMALAEGEEGQDVKLLPNGRLDDIVNQYSVRFLCVDTRQRTAHRRV